MTAAISETPELPKIIVRDQTLRRLKSGYPWVLREDLARVKQLDLDPGTMVDFVGKDGMFAARGYFNHKVVVAGRAFTRYHHEPVDAAFFEKRIRTALEKREKLYPDPYYRLIHAESDGFPGLIVDRYGDVLVCQVNTAGMEKLYPEIEKLLVSVLSPRAIVLRNDTSSRIAEKLPEEVRVSYGKLPNPRVHMVENGVNFQADVLEGQKTGWFFDQRDNRLDVANLASGKTFIDIFCHTGGFGVTAATKGATAVTFIDSSELALEQARRNAELNRVAGECTFIEGKAFEVMEQLAKDSKKFDIVCVDPPAFIKSRDDYATGLRGYQKLAKLAAPLVADGGYLFFASCSHHATLKDLIRETTDGLKKSGRDFNLTHTGTAAADHPVHPLLSETGYLKGLLFKAL